MERVASTTRVLMEAMAEVKVVLSAAVGAEEEREAAVVSVGGVRGLALLWEVVRERDERGELY